MKGALVHGLLLLAALAIAVPTWLREPFDVRTGVSVWSRAAEQLSTIRYRSQGRELVIERRTEEGESFLWGVEVTTSEAGGESDTLGFPLGAYGGQVVDAFTDLRALRVLDSAAVAGGGLGLDAPRGRVSIDFSNESRVLEIGDSVYGSSARYVRDADAGTVFVLSGDVLSPLLVGAEALRERQLHRFDMAQVARVRVELGDAGPTLERLASRREGFLAWTDPDGDAEADAAFGDLMQRVATLAIAGFDGERAPDRASRLVRIEYLDDRADRLGYLELYREARAGDARRYLVRTERTRVPAVAMAVLAQRVEEGLEALTRDNAAGLP